MKNCFFILTLALTTIFNQAFTNPVIKDHKCRLDTILTVMSPNKRLARIESDLINNTWVENKSTDTNVVKVAFDFSDLGTLTITTNYIDQTSSIDNTIWRIDTQDEVPVLILTNTATDEFTIYKIEETCSGIVLKDDILNRVKSLVVSH